MIRIFSFLFFLGFLGLKAQTLENGDLKNSKYLEDQFYVGITYNFLLNQPNGVAQRNLSYGLFGGFIKDIPLNKNRTNAIGIGLGYAVNSYYSNLLASKENTGMVYSVLGDDAMFKRNKIETHLVELPFQYRWRNSTATEYKFWRIYTGVKLGYVFGGRSKFISDTENISFRNSDIRQFQYGLTFDFGWNTFNMHIYYALNNLFNDNLTIGDETIEMKPLRVGLIFYIL